jgi:hypothetical protein
MPLHHSVNARHLLAILTIDPKTDLRGKYGLQLGEGALAISPSVQSVFQVHDVERMAISTLT